MSLRTFASSSDERVIAGVCAGIAQTLGVDATLVRLVFALLALAGGSRDPPLPRAVGVGGRAASLDRRAARARRGLPHSSGALGLSEPVGRRDRADRGRARARLAPGRQLPSGRAAVLRRASRSRRSARCVLLSGGGTSSTLLAPGAVAGALLLIAGPWVWRLALERDVERTARIRSEERSDMAARVHDSVLQTLALIQRHAHEPRRVASLARRQERELRGWLYGDQPLGDDSASMIAALVGGGRRRRGTPRRTRRAGERR